LPNLAASLWSGPGIVVVLVVLNDVAPTDAEWETFAHIAEQNVRSHNVHSLALTDGGGPNATQRARVNAILGKGRDRNIHSAVVTESPMIRGVVGVLRLFHPDTEAFSPPQIQSALGFIGLAEAHWPSLWAAVMEADARISPRSAIVHRSARFLESRSAASGGDAGEDRRLR
jgi:hypothetical protein